MFLLTNASEFDLNSFGVMTFRFEQPEVMPFYSKSQQLTFKGWAIPLIAEGCITLVFKRDADVIYRANLSEKRPDVRNAFKLSHEHGEKFGFRIDVDLEKIDSIFLDCDGVSKQIFDVKKINNLNCSSNELSEFKTIFDLGKTHTDKTKAILDEILNQGTAFFNQTILTKHSTSTPLLESIFPSHIVDFIKMAENDIKSNDWNLNAIKRLIHGGNIFSFESNTKVYSNFSQGDMNYLLLHTEEKFYYIVQYCGNIGFYFPIENIFLYLTPIQQWIDASIAHIQNILFLTLKKYISNNYRFIECKFEGAMISQSRPYHYFYDGLNFLSKLILDENKFTNFSILSIAEYSFIEISEVFPSIGITFHISNLDDFNMKQCTVNTFYLLGCYQYHLSQDDEPIRFLDSKLIDYSNKCDLASSNILQNIFSSSELIIWFGLSSEKRTAEGLLEGIKMIANQLKGKRKKITFCFDGRTTPLLPSPSDAAMIAKELALSKSIVNEINDDQIVFLNLSGLKSIEKIFIANHIDYFFSSFGTDSLYVSRICRKEGFAYYPANIGGARNMHIHPNAQLVQCEIPNESAEKPWHLSDSIIDWDLFLSHLIDFLNRQGTKND